MLNLKENKLVRIFREHPRFSDLLQYEKLAKLEDDDFQYLDERDVLLLVPVGPDQTLLKIVLGKFEKEIWPSSGQFVDSDAVNLDLLGPIDWQPEIETENVKLPNRRIHADFMSSVSPKGSKSVSELQELLQIGLGDRRNETTKSVNMKANVCIAEFS
jgi:hypothetical protein